MFAQWPGLLLLHNRAGEMVIRERDIGAVLRIERTWKKSSRLRLALPKVPPVETVPE
jgi:hypothetical protein